MAESKRSKQREAFRQQLSQTWDDAQIQRTPEKAPEAWESDRVVEVKGPEAPAPPPEIPPPPEPAENLFPEPPDKPNHWELLLAWIHDHGFTHPSWGGWLQLPREFDAVLATERRAVAQIVLEIMRQTLGWIDPDGDVDEDGRPKRVEWAHIDYKHFSAICNGSPSQARIGLKIAEDKKYIERRRIKGHKGGGFEYRIRWSPAKPSSH